jgi:hypothetical protein
MEPNFRPKPHVFKPRNGTIKAVQIKLSLYAEGLWN